MATIVSERYALSLYELAKDEGRAGPMFEQLCEVVQIFRDNPDFMKVLTTPSIPFAEKQKVIKEVFEGRIDAYLLNFLLLITEKGRVSLLYEMEDAYKDMYYLDEGICEVTAVTAAPMDEALAEKLRVKMESVTGKKVKLRTKVDPELLGGIVVKVDNKQIDTSIKTRLEELGRTMAQTIA